MKTSPEGVSSQVEMAYIRGSQIKFVVLPDALSKAPFFNRIKMWRKFKGHAVFGAGGLITGNARGQSGAIIKKSLERRMQVQGGPGGPGGDHGGRGYGGPPFGAGMGPGPPRGGYQGPGGGYGPPGGGAGYGPPGGFQGGGGRGFPPGPPGGGGGYGPPGGGGGGYGPPGGDRGGYSRGPY